ncbi:hypothetical protein K491DRAFT_696379 [Lophiostoma macrostomum CBS 122681]|uniref:Uncharacterized protein n=1 Tax=Lophiostoma macrostomum CBS 122681 TaxID=1314788 RepID=A0A6A6SV25_9PLEO|nr:hypothetical protein K491DRAFT_696379 [Lophiostoma macrostomum CBS 122681]
MVLSHLVVLRYLMVLNHPVVLHHALLAQSHRAQSRNTGATQRERPTTTRHTGTPSDQQILGVIGTDDSGSGRAHDAISSWR